MDDLVRDFQEEIFDLLKPVSQRNDLYTQESIRKRNIIVLTWYRWIQEIFCDAVGFTIGGPCFAKAFGMYFRMGERDEFHLPLEKLTLSTHPVTWLRVRLLADLVRQIGNQEDADKLEKDWDMIAATMNITEDYYGFYEPEFLPPIRKTINDMLIEVSPYQFTDADVSPSNWNPESSSPVHLLNQAWFIFLNDPNGYRSWEEQAIREFISKY